MSTDTARPTRAYLYIDQLAALTPWSATRIRAMMSEGTFIENVHFFRPKGSGTRPIFSWAAVQSYIERNGTMGAAQAAAEVVDDEMRLARALLR